MNSQSVRSGAPCCACVRASATNEGDVLPQTYPLATGQPYSKLHMDIDLDDSFEDVHISLLSLFGFVVVVVLLILTPSCCCSGLPGKAKGD